MQPQWVVGTPPAPQPAPVGWSIALDSNGNIVLSGATQPGGAIQVLLIAASGGDVIRSTLTPAQATALGITLDSGGKIAVLP